ncbi:general transcription factor IIF subunit 1 [Cimex lectularius]|uniref:Transcription initiation factor IIF subunit alpha n=1 Tax=Cimex lectularius TaxID=79782 RepID=A0A8I6SA39_CIMLE|nr:general transcription factor IIF subunit 1 [Cimex lectularius]
MNNSPGAAPTVQEYSIKVPKNSRKSYHVMRFNSVQNVDFTKWSQVKMERENNIKEFKTQDEEQPKFGAGSEYGREAREEARRKKYGIITRRYKPEDQPWILKVGGKSGKKFKGIREGGVAENASYYVFTHAADGGIEAYPLNEWYNFQAIQRYKALSAEEAEQEFGRRNKVMNYFSLMMRKRLKNDEDGEGEEEEKPKKGRKSNELKISEMDDWIDSEEDESESDDEEGEKKEKKEKDKKKKKVPEKKKKRKGSDESAVEESDDGDEEGRELDYISDSSDSESDHDAKVVKEMKGVAEESALRRLLTSDEEEDEEEKKEEEKEGEKVAENKDAEKNDGKDAKDAKKRKRKKKSNEKKKNDDSSSDSSGDSSDSDTDKSKDNGSSSNAQTPAEKKVDPVQTKKPRMEMPLLSYGGENGITEEAVRRYLMRKPMTATELLQKFKNRKTGLSSEQLVNVMTQILQKINPVKQKTQNKMYLSLKPQ